MFKNKLAINTFLYTVTLFLNKGMAFLLLPILTRYLTPYDYGILATIQVIIGFLSIFVNMSINSAVLMGYFQLSTSEHQIYIWNGIIAILINSMVVGLIFLILYSNLYITLKLSYVLM